MSDELVLPTFLIIGAMKAGTTSLHQYLRAHPSVFMPEDKEPQFFSEPERWARGASWYSTLFEPAADFPVRGEASTGYTRFPRYPEAPARMASLLPDVRLVYLLRDPVERMRSHYRHGVILGREQRPVDEALLGRDGYLDTSRYAMQLRRYLEHFPREQILVVFSEELRRSPMGTLGAVCRFVGADPGRLPNDLGGEQHVSDQRLRVPAHVRRLAGAPPARWLRRRLPAPSRALGRLVAKGADFDDRPTESTRAQLLDWLSEDLADLRRLVGPLPASWRIDA